MEVFLWSLLVLASFLIIYHHAGYPLLLKWMAKGKTQEPYAYFRRQYKESALDPLLPSISLIIPAHNESDCIKDKIRNLACLDYPPSRFKVVLVCDGCTDDTVEQATSAFKETECKHLKYEIHDYSKNRGKLIRLHQTISKNDSDIIALSDTSALLSHDSLLIAAGCLSHDEIGVVTGRYCFLDSLSPGENAYWDYQTRIKTQESVTGSTLGVHGAFYAFRRNLYQSVPEDTINDDFAIPMNIVLKGYRCLYDPRMVAIELEQASDNADFKRRVRIAAGNLQQAIRYRGLLHPRLGLTAVNFFSGKFIRTWMPACFLLVLACPALLTREYSWLWILVIPQLLAWITALYFMAKGSVPELKLVKIGTYILSGHMAMAAGTVSYLMGQHKGPWKRVTEQTN
ncbi:glycosyltransferase family 2 protein [Spongorhabdus nitratireducens]